MSPDLDAAMASIMAHDEQSNVVVKTADGYYLGGRMGHSRSKEIPIVLPKRRFAMPSPPKETGLTPFGLWLRDRLTRFRISAYSYGQTKCVEFQYRQRPALAIHWGGWCLLTIQSYGRYWHFWKRRSVK